MGDPVRVTVETETDSRAVRSDDDDGSVTVDDVTFRFDVGGMRGGDSSGAEEASPHSTAADHSTVAAEETDESTTSTDALRVTTLDDVPSKTTLRFEVRTGRHGVEGILQRQGDDVVAWENRCAHEPDVRLDEGMGAFVVGGQLVCDNHGARFNCDDGFCTRGPCQGQSLRPISVTVRDDEVYVTDDRFESARKLGL